jgi:hypothetical protein
MAVDEGGEGEEDAEQDEMEIRTELFATRFAFLRICQSNHWQFDTLRRAKFASTMLLYLLRRVDLAPMLLWCCKCEKELLTDARWLCDLCTDYAVCEDCLPTVRHPHRLRRERERMPIGPSDPYAEGKGAKEMDDDTIMALLADTDDEEDEKEDGKAMDVDLVEL